MTQTQTAITPRYLDVASGRAFSCASQWGYRARVDADGTVLVYDDVADAYTRRHALTARQIARVRREAR